MALRLRQSAVSAAQTRVSGYAVPTHRVLIRDLLTTVKVERTRCFDNFSFFPRTELIMIGIRNFMTNDHRRCDDIFAAVEQAAGKAQPEAARAAFAQFRSAMLAHFDSEEQTLFPAFEARTGMSMGPTQVMRMEHVQMRALMDDAGEALQAGNLDDYFGIAETLLIMMQQHNTKEENMLYPMCDQHLAGDAAVLEQLKTALASP